MIAYYCCISFSQSINSSCILHYERTLVVTTVSPFTLVAPDKLCLGLDFPSLAAKFVLLPPVLAEDRLDVLPLLPTADVRLVELPDRLVLLP